MDWVDWHRRYELADSPYGKRLALVRQEIRRALDDATTGPLRLISMCAGDGRDVLGVLPEHPRGREVTARLLELDPRLAASGRAAAAAAGLDRVDVVTGDAAVADAYLGAVPADIVLVCGVFGNITDADIGHTVRQLPRLCAAGARVVWTRHRRAPDLTPAIRGWFAEAGFEELAFHRPDGTMMSVGAHRLTGPPAPYAQGMRMFTFVPEKATRETDTEG